MIIEKVKTPTSKYTFLRRDDMGSQFSGKYTVYRDDGTINYIDYNKFDKNVGITIAREYQTPDIRHINYHL